jgi:hypothetical protein
MELEQIPVGTPVLYWPGERTGPGRRSKTRSEPWRMGSGELVVKVYGHEGGIALTHIQVRRELPPPLDFQLPDCSVCGKRTDHDGDHICCYSCGIYWPTNTDEGEWTDEDAKRCEATHQPFALNAYANGKPYQFDTERCMLTAGHDGKHRADQITEWTDDTAVNGRRPAAAVAP